MQRPDPTAQKVLAAFGEPGRRARWHTTLRWVSCPFPAIEAMVPARGRVLDFGCGHGHFAMYLALTSPTRHVVGVDIDGAKVHDGTRVLTRAGLGGRVELRHVDDRWLPEPATYDAVVANDVLYLMGHDRAGVVLDALAAAVGPSGTAVVKEVASTRSWKHLVARTQEVAMVRVLGLTDGATIELVDPDEVEDRLRRAGLGVRREDLGRGYPHAHVAFVGHRNAA